MLKIRPSCTLCTGLHTPAQLNVALQHLHCNKWTATRALQQLNCNNCIDSVTVSLFVHVKKYDMKEQQILLHI